MNDSAQFRFSLVQRIYHRASKTAKPEWISAVVDACRGILSDQDFEAACGAIAGLSGQTQRDAFTNLASAVWGAYRSQHQTHISYHEGARLNPLGYAWLRMTTRALSLLNSKTTPTYRDFFLELQKIAGEDENREKFNAAIKHGNEWLDFIENERHPPKPTETPQESIQDPQIVAEASQTEIVRFETLKQANGGKPAAGNKEKEYAQEPAYDDLPL